jgi:hypothetical protein
VLAGAQDRIGLGDGGVGKLVEGEGDAHGQRPPRECAWSWVAGAARRHAPLTGEISADAMRDEDGGK